MHSPLNQSNTLFSYERAGKICTNSLKKIRKHINRPIQTKAALSKDLKSYEISLNRNLPGLLFSHRQREVLIEARTHFFNMKL
jgi:hypothetical protein